MAKLIVAQEGGSVSSTERNLGFTSDRNCFIELISGTQSISSTGYYQHGLGYSPAYTVFMKVNPAVSGIPQSWTPCVGFLGNVLDGGLVTIDTDKLYFETYQVYNETTEEYEYVTTDFYFSIFSNKTDDATGTGKDNASGKIKIAKSGLSIPNITDARQFQFFVGNAFKQDVALSGETSLTTIDYDFEVVEITHNLGYVPIIFCQEKDNGSRIPYGLPSGFILTYYITSTKLYIVGGNFFSEGGDTINISYKILRDKIN